MMRCSLRCERRLRADALNAYFDYQLDRNGFQFTDRKAHLRPSVKHDVQKAQRFTPGVGIRFGIIGQRHVKRGPFFIGIGVGETVHGTWVTLKFIIYARRAHLLFECLDLLWRHHGVSSASKYPHFSGRIALGGWRQTGRAPVWTPVTWPRRMPSAARHAAG